MIREIWTVAKSLQQAILFLSLPMMIEKNPVPGRDQVSLGCAHCAQDLGPQLRRLGAQVLKLAQI